MRACVRGRQADAGARLRKPLEHGTSPYIAGRIDLALLDVVAPSSPICLLNSLQLE